MNSFPPPRQLLRGARPCLTLEGVSRSFGTRTVLHKLDLSIQQGEFIAIVGSSGCGKSTLLRLMAGLDQPDAGNIRYDTSESEQDHDHDQRAANRLMFQEARLLPWKRVLDNVSLGLPGISGKAEGRHWLAQVGLAERANDWPMQLSGGQKQRVALARALAHRPRLLLLDEPLGALDALTRIEMQQLIESLWLAQGMSAVLVTHDVSEAVALADRVLVMQDGHIAYECRLDMPRPRRRDTAALAGIEARLLAHVMGTAQPEKKAA